MNPTKKTEGEFDDGSYGDRHNALEQFRVCPRDSKGNAGGIVQNYGNLAPQPRIGLGLGLAAQRAMEQNCLSDLCLIVNRTFALRTRINARQLRERIMKAGENSTIWAAASPKFIVGGSDEDKYDYPTQKL